MQNKFYLEFFNNVMSDVVEWNGVPISGKHEFTLDRIKMQETFVFEELRETIAAVASGDLKETVDGLCDVLVTLSYMYYLQSEGKDLVSLDDDCCLEPSVADVLNTLICIMNLTHRDTEFDENDTLIAIQCLYDLFKLYHEKQGVDMVVNMNAVQESNWSKYPKFVSDEECESECRWIEENRKKENVGYVVQNGLVVYRDKFGKGKIMKPSAFKEPELQV